MKQAVHRKEVYCRERERDRQTDRQRETERHTERHRERDRQKDRSKEKETAGQFKLKKAQNCSMTLSCP